MRCFIKSQHLLYMEKNIKMSYKNNEIEISAPTWNDKFELPDGITNFENVLL